MLKDTTPLLISVASFCSLAGIGRTTAYQEIGNGNLPTLKVGRRRLIPMRAAHRWVEQHLLKSAQNPFAAACIVHQIVEIDDQNGEDQ